MVNTAPAGTITNVGQNGFYLTVDGANLGYTETSLSFLAEIATKPIQFGQDSQPQGANVSEQTITLELEIDEVTNANFVKYLGGLATLDGATLYYGDQKGDSLTTYEIKLYPLHPIGHPWCGRVFTFHKCNILPNGSMVLDPASDEYNNLPIKINVLKDSAQTAGQEFFSFAAAVATAPTVSSTTPANSGTNVDDEADIVITFSQAMGIGTISSESILICTTDLSGAAYADVITGLSFSLGTNDTVLTISHTEAFDAGDVYQCIITTGVRNAAGVALAAPYVFTFTVAT